MCVDIYYLVRYKSRASVELDGQLPVIRCKDSLSLDKDASFKTHIEKIAARARSKTWTLAKLRKKGLSEKNLVKTYRCCGVSQIFMICNSDGRIRRSSGFSLCIHRMHAVRKMGM